MLMKTEIAKTPNSPPTCSLLTANCSLLMRYTATPLHKADSDMRLGKWQKPLTIPNFSTNS